MENFINENLLSTFFLSILLLVIFILGYKKIKGLKFIFGILVALFIPIVFIVFLKICYFYLPGNTIGEVGDWIAFSGGYIGAIIALTGIWWQLDRTTRVTKEKAVDNALTYINFFVKFNLDNINKKKIEFIYEEYLHFEKNIIPTNNMYIKLYEIESEFIQNNLTTYIELGIIEDVYKIKEMINEFNIRGNLYFKELNENRKFLETFLNDISFQDIKQNETFSLLNKLLKIISKIIFKYNSATLSGHIIDLYFIDRDLNYLKKECLNYKKIEDYFFIEEIEEIFKNSNFIFLSKLDLLKNIQNEKIIPTFNINDSLLLSAAYLSLLQHIIFKLKLFKYSDEQKLKKLENIYFNLKYI